MSKTNPFADLDFTKFMGEFKMPGMDFKMPEVNVDLLVQAQRKNFEAFASANQLAFEGIQAVAKRQGDIVRETIEELTKIGKELASVDQAPEARVAKQAELAKAGFEKAIANLRELSDMMIKANGEAAEVITHRISEALDEVKDAAINGKAHTANGTVWHA
ncbi:MAG: phasin family protein [Rhodospirillales bacterium]